MSAANKIWDNPLRTTKLLHVKIWLTELREKVNECPDPQLLDRSLFNRDTDKRVVAFKNRIDSVSTDLDECLRLAKDILDNWLKETNG